jgi:copper homeostasis protein
MSIEICTFSVQSSIDAQNAGANRIELCGGMGDGGTTPSAGLISLVRKNIYIDLYVMNRPRGGDFCYSDTEFQVMKQDIELAKQQNVDGVALGILLPDGSIDIKRTQELVAFASPLKVTFHRAFDMCQDPMQGMEDIIKTGCVRILTSGQKPTAVEGIAVLQEMQIKANNRIEIMAGAGITDQNISTLLEKGIKHVHLTAKKYYPSKMQFRQSNISMASTLQNNDEYRIMEADIEQIRAIYLLMK